MIDNVIKTIVNNKLSDLHTCLVCEVTKLSPLQVKPKATRDLLGEDTDYPIIEVVKLSQPVITLEMGDTVVVIFNERALDDVGTRKHDLSDGIVIGKLD